MVAEHSVIFLYEIRGWAIYLGEWVEHERFEMVVKEWKKRTHKRQVVGLTGSIGKAL